jgi:hypothetical protein
MPGLARPLRRQLARSVDKAEMIRAFVNLASTDEAIHAALIEELRR